MGQEIFSSFEPPRVIRFGKAYPADPAGLDCLTHCYSIKPATAPLATRDHPELTATFAQPLTDGVHELGREWPGADAGGVGLGNAENKPERPPRDPRSGRGLPGNRIR